MEYLPCGDLLGYLRKSRGIEDKYHHGESEVAELSTYDFVSFARQIATGMAFLASKGVRGKIEIYTYNLLDCHNQYGKWLRNGLIRYSDYQAVGSVGLLRKQGHSL